MTKYEFCQPEDGTIFIFCQLTTFLSIHGLSNSLLISQLRLEIRFSK